MKNIFKLIWFFCVIVFFHIEIMAATQNQNTTTTTTATVSATAKKTKVQQNVTDPLAQSNVGTLNSWIPNENISAYVDMTASRGRDELAPVFGSLSLTTTVGLVNTDAIQFGFGYERPLEKYAQDADQYSLSDINVSYIHSNPFKLENPLTLIYGLVIPTSELSDRRTLRTTFSVLANYKLLSFWNNKSSLTALAGPYRSFHRFRQQNVIGSSYNTPYGLLARVTWAHKWQKRLATSVYYQAVPSIDYADKSRMSQRIYTGFSYAWDARFSMTGSFRWQDNAESDHALFDDDTTEVSMGLRVNI